MSVEPEDQQWYTHESDYAVSGYVRECHNLLQSSSYTLFANIPYEISSLCLLFYFKIPCLGDLMTTYLSKTNQTSTTNELLTILNKYRLNNKVIFIYQLVSKVTDMCTTEKSIHSILRLLECGIISKNELENGFTKFFQGYTWEDNPKLALHTSQLLAPLIVENVIKFPNALQWALLDIRKNQNKDMLQFYDGDGMRNYIKGSNSITIALEFLAMLILELNNWKWEDKKYVKTLIDKCQFNVDQYINQQDLVLCKTDKIRTEWINQYNLQFAFYN